LRRDRRVEATLLAAITKRASLICPNLAFRRWKLKLKWRVLTRALRQYTADETLGSFRRTGLGDFPTFAQFCVSSPRVALARRKRYRSCAKRGQWLGKWVIFRRWLVLSGKTPLFEERAEGLRLWRQWIALSKAMICKIRRSRIETLRHRAFLIRKWANFASRCRLVVLEDRWYEMGGEHCTDLAAIRNAGQGISSWLDSRIGFEPVPQASIAVLRYWAPVSPPVCLVSRVTCTLDVTGWIGRSNLCATLDNFVREKRFIRFKLRPSLWSALVHRLDRAIFRCRSESAAAILSLQCKGSGEVSPMIFQSPFEDP
jgi:hypothetical protein